MTASDLRFEGSYVLEPDQVYLPGTGFRAGVAVAVAGGVFTDVGPAAEVRSRRPDAPVARLEGLVLLPGFVDAHHHLSQALGSTLAYGEPSEIFRRIWLPLEQALTPEELGVSARLAALESLRGGFITVVDAGTRSAHDVELMVEQTEDAGLRCVIGKTCADIPPGSPPAREVLRAAEQHLDRFAGRPLVHPSLAVPVPEVATPEVLVQVSKLSAAAGCVWQSHVNEHLASVERSILETGRRPLEYLDCLGILDAALLAAHVTLITPAEALLLAQAGTAVSYNPVASSWKGNAVAPALLLADLGVRVGLGTDGTRGDGFRLMDAAETAQRFATAMTVGDPFGGGGRRWLDAATSGGAHAAGLGDVTGSIEAGKSADFLLVDTRVPDLVPSFDLAWELVRVGNRDQLRAVVTAGTTRLVDGWPVGWDGRELLGRASRHARAAIERAGLSLRPWADR